MEGNNKNIETKDRIIIAGRELFFDNGYNNTTSRMIAEKSGANLGLLNYYFKNKIEIANIIYDDIRNSFNDLILENEKEIDPISLFLLSSVLELYLCLNCPNYGRFYKEIIFDLQIHMNIQNTIVDVLGNYMDCKENDPYPTLASLSISAIKPALVTHALASPGSIDTKSYLKYYVEAQLHYLKVETIKSDDILNILNSYYINIVNMFTPILTKIIKPL